MKGLFLFLILGLLSSCGDGKNASSMQASVTNAVVAEKPLGNRYVLAKSGLNLRDKPDISATRLDSAMYGATVILIDDGKEKIPFEFDGIKGYWALVEYDKKRGYLFSGYLTTLSAPRFGTPVEVYMDKEFGKSSNINRITEGKSSFHTQDILSVTTNAKGETNSIQTNTITNSAVSSPQSNIVRPYTRGAEIVYEGLVTVCKLPVGSIEEAFVIFKQLNVDFFGVTTFPTGGKLEKSEVRVERTENGYQVESLSITKNKDEYLSFRKLGDNSVEVRYTKTVKELKPAAKQEKKKK